MTVRLTLAPFDPGAELSAFCDHRGATGAVASFVLTASAHRRAALEACDFLIDYLKSRAPFWKREFGPSGPRWVEPTAQDFADLDRWN